jgi:hypothetical protein
MPQYIYKPIQNPESIRLLMLAPGKGDDPLEVFLWETPLPVPEPYGAISYAWESQTKCFTLHAPEGDIPITASLNSVLKRVREENTIVQLWADGVCINQEDNNEKSHQVRLMSRIYRSASNVAVYLGEEADDSDLAIEVMTQMWAARLERWPDRLGINPLPDTWSWEKIPRPGDKAWDALEAFFRRPWFKRVWIIQELAVGSIVMVVCGKRELPWDVVYTCSNICSRHNRDAMMTNQVIADGVQATGLLGLIRKAEQESKPWELLELLNLFRYTEATLARDHLFALRGLAVDGADQAFDPDYNSPFESIVRKYAATFIQRGKVMTLLHYAGIGSDSDRFPSWIPDWVCAGKAYKKKPLGIANPEYNAAPGTKLEVNLDPAMEILTIRGLKVDKIVQLSQSLREKGNSGEAYLSEVVKMIASLDLYPTGEALSELHWRVPIGNKSNLFLEAPREDPNLEDLKNSYRALRKRNYYMQKYDNLLSQVDETFSSDSQVKIAEIISGLLPDFSTLETLSRVYFNTLIQFFGSTRFCVTERGYVGVLQPTAQVGDIVCILFGGRVPFLVRQTEVKNGSYQLVGECYIHGIMNGEALKFEGVEEQDFRIC